MPGTDWETSKACTPLKRDLLRAIFRLHTEFFLTGGSALGIFYLEHRRSYGMDFFSFREIDWHRLSNDLTAICSDIGARLKNLQISPHYARYEIQRDEEKEILDFVHEMTPQINAEKSRFDDIAVDTVDEITVNKWCALLGRTEIKDIIDLYFLSKTVDIWSLFKRAREKEGGVDPSMLSYTLSQITITETPDYLIADVSADEIEHFIADVRGFLDKMSFPQL